MITDIKNGIKAYFKAFALISKLRLWKYFVIPIVISIFVALFIFKMANGLSDNFSEYITNFWKWDFGKSFFKTTGKIISALSIIILGLILYKHIVLALAAPFMSPVSEKIENHFKGDNHQHRKTSFQEQLIRGVRISLRNISLELSITVVLLIFSVVLPIFGVIFTVISFMVQAYFAGFGNIDYTLERHYKYQESIAFVKRNKGLAIGNGLIFMLFLLIPFLGVIIVLPLSVTAATTETIKKLK